MSESRSVDTKALIDALGVIPGLLGAQPSTEPANGEPDPWATELDNLLKRQPALSWTAPLDCRYGDCQFRVHRSGGCFYLHYRGTDGWGVVNSQGIPDLQGVIRAIAAVVARDDPKAAPKAEVTAEALWGRATTAAAEPDDVDEDNVGDADLDEPGPEGAPAEGPFGAVENWVQRWRKMAPAEWVATLAWQLTACPAVSNISYNVGAGCIDCRHSGFLFRVESCGSGFHLSLHDGTGWRALSFAPIPTVDDVVKDMNMEAAEAVAKAKAATVVLPPVRYEVLPPGSPLLPPDVRQTAGSPPAAPQGATQPEGASAPAGDWVADLTERLRDCPGMVFVAPDTKRQQVESQWTHTVFLVERAEGGFRCSRRGAAGLGWVAVPGVLATIDELLPGMQFANDLAAERAQSKRTPAASPDGETKAPPTEEQIAIDVLQERALRLSRLLIGRLRRDTLRLYEDLCDDAHDLKDAATRAAGIAEALHAMSEV